MKNIYILSMLLMAAFSLTSCDDNLSAEQEQPNAPVETVVKLALKQIK